MVAGFMTMLMTGTLCAAPVGARAATVTITCASTGQELEQCRLGTESWSRKTGHTVKLVTMPSSDGLSLIQQLLAAGSTDIDVFQVDVVWTGILAAHLLDLRAVAGPSVAQHFPAYVQTATIGGRLVAIPWFGDAGLLYYRKDLLAKYGKPVPRTWAELTDTAREIQAAERAAGQSKFWGYVWQGRAYEGLTCNALEWVASHSGGTVVDAQGRVTINNPGAVQALQQAASWVGTISPKGVLNYTEEEGRGIFQSGQAVFMRNWPYAWSLVNAPGSPVQHQVGVAALPGSASGPSTGTLAGSMLAVNRHSKQADLAADLVLHLTSRAEQKRRAIAASYNPTIPALYHDPEVLAATPFLSSLFDTFDRAVGRPSTSTGTRYNRVSIEFSNAVHTVLSGELTAEESLRGLDGRLRRIRRGGSW